MLNPPIGRFPSRRFVNRWVATNHHRYASTKNLRIGFPPVDMGNPWFMEVFGIENTMEVFGRFFTSPDVWESISSSMNPEVPHFAPFLLGHQDCPCFSSYSSLATLLRKMQSKPDKDLCESLRLTWLLRCDSLSHVLRKLCRFNEGHVANVQAMTFTAGSISAPAAL